MNYEKQRMIELDMQAKNLEMEKVRLEMEKVRIRLETKRQCVELARSFEPENSDALVADAKKIQSFFDE